MPEEFVRARQESTGHLAALPKESLALGFHPGWVAVDGPVPSGPKAAVLRTGETESTEGDTSGEPVDGGPAETTGVPPEDNVQSADSKSARKKE